MFAALRERYMESRNSFWSATAKFGEQGFKVVVPFVSDLMESWLGILKSPKFEFFPSGPTDSETLVIGDLVFISKKLHPKQSNNNLLMRIYKNTNYCPCTRARHLSPKCFWPVDKLELAEKLIEKLI